MRPDPGIDRNPGAHATSQRIVDTPTLPGPEMGNMLTSAPESDEPTAGDVGTTYPSLAGPLLAVAGRPRAGPGATPLERVDLALRLPA